MLIIGDGTHDEEVLELGVLLEMAGEGCLVLRPDADFLLDAARGSITSGRLDEDGLVASGRCVDQIHADFLKLLVA
jgi:hypothetical protein